MKKNVVLLLIISIITLFSGVFFVRAATSDSFLYMTWETIDNNDVYYSGKILASKDSVVKFSIQPLIYSSGAYVDSTKLNYRWYVNDKLQKEGVDIKIFRYRIPSYQVEESYSIKVVVLNENNELGSKTVNIIAANPRIVIKPEDVSLRIKNNIIVANNSEIKIKAIPYFFNYNNLSDLKASWFINGEKQKNDNENQLIFSVSGSGSGLVNVGIQILNNSNVFIKAIEKIDIQFINL